MEVGYRADKFHWGNILEENGMASLNNYHLPGCFGWSVLESQKMEKDIIIEIILATVVVICYSVPGLIQNVDPCIHI